MPNLNGAEPSYTSPDLVGTNDCPGPISSSPQMGRIWNSRGAASYHGSSYFGHQSAASLMEMESPQLPVGMGGIHASNSSHRSDQLFHRGGKEPYAHIWELIGCLPRRKVLVDHLVKRFLEELNPIYDSVHKSTFKASYDMYWNRRWGDDDLTAVDLRWLALLFMVLAFAELLDCPMNASTEIQRRSEETSVQFFWASRKAIVLAPTISGESPDLVRAGILVSRYLLYFGRKTESWLTSSFAIRMAQAQGMHLDGESWGLPPKVLQTRRRLWCTLASLDRSLSLATGRPYTVNGKHCMQMNIRNIWLDDKSDDDAFHTIEQQISDPTPTIYHRYQQQMSVILGDIQDDCFGFTPTTTSYATYEKVLHLDNALKAWADALPSYFRLLNSDTSIDLDHSFLPWQRMYLHSSYHFARITLHRTYVLLESLTDRFETSRHACISSARADLRMKLNFRPCTMAERLKAGIGMHSLFNSALILGIIAVKEPFAAQTRAILEDLTAFCEKQRSDIWVNEFTLAEIKVVELCIASSKRLICDGKDRLDRRREVAGAARDAGAGTSLVDPLNHLGSDHPAGPLNNNLSTSSRLDAGSLGDHESWLDNWFGPMRNFPDPIDFQFWEHLVGSLEST